MSQKRMREALEKIAEHCKGRMDAEIAAGCPDGITPIYALASIVYGECEAALRETVG